MSDFVGIDDLASSVLQRHLKMRRLGKVESREGKRLVAVALSSATLSLMIPAMADALLL